MSKVLPPAPPEKRDMEIPHSELEKWHYRALKNPLYRLEGMMDVQREEFMGYLPYQREEPESIPEPPRVNRQWDEVQQLKSEVVGWRKKHSLALKEIDLLKTKVNRSLRKYPIDTYNYISIKEEDDLPENGKVR